MAKEEVKRTDCCGNWPTHRSREVLGRLYCDHHCYMREAQALWDDAKILAEGGVKKGEKTNVLKLERKK